MWHRYYAGEDYKPGLNVYFSRSGLALHWMTTWRGTRSLFLRWAWRPSLKMYHVRPV